MSRLKIRVEVIGMKPTRARHPQPSQLSVEAEVALRAFEKWLLRGRAEGSQLQDWLEAEDEIRQRREMARLLTEAERRLLAEHAVSRILSASCLLSEAAPKIIQAICENLGWDVGEIWLVDQQIKLISCFAIWHAPGHQVAEAAQLIQNLNFSPGTDIPGRVWAQQSLVWIPDLAVDADLARTPIATKVGLHTAVGFPIATETAFLGVIVLCSRDIRQPDEELVETMTSVLLDLNQFIERTQAEEKVRRQELERSIAREVQHGLLPKAVPRLTGIEIAGRSMTAEDVGGDCFDFFPSSVDGRQELDILIADASGHGIAAALLMAETRAYVRALTLNSTDLGTLLNLTNTRLAEDLLPGHFVTLFLVRLDPLTRSLRYVGAGHWPAYVLSRQGDVRLTLASTGIPVGIELGREYSTGPTVQLESGDLVFLFTDGVVEAASPDGRLFGLKQTLDIVRTLRRRSPDEILDALFRTVSDFSDNRLKDDVTAIVIQVQDVG